MKKAMTFTDEEKEKYIQLIQDCRNDDLPYFDWKRLRTEVPWPLRDKLLNASIIQHGDSMVSVFTEARYRAGARLKNLILDNFGGITARNGIAALVRELGYDNSKTSILSYAVNGKRPFSVTLDLLNLICGKLKITVNNLLMGEEHPIILPRYWGYVIDAVQSVGGEDAEGLLKEMQTVANKRRKNIDYRDQEIYKGLCLQRTKSCAKDMGCRVRRITTTKYNSHFNTTLDFFDLRMDYDVRLNTVMELGFEMDQGVDYFCIPRYADNCQLQYFDKDNALKALKVPANAKAAVKNRGKVLQNIISDVEAMDELERQNTMADIYAIVMRFMVGSAANDQPNKETVAAMLKA